MLPLGLIGVVAALLVFGRPLGFVAILGILALIGMIAKNAVILITQIEADRAEGLNVWDAVVAASSSRLRPMTLTAISTVLGLIPIAPTVFWGPMAFAIMGGLLVATHADAGLPADALRHLVRRQGGRRRARGARAGIVQPGLSGRAASREPDDGKDFGGSRALGGVLLPLAGDRRASTLSICWSAPSPRPRRPGPACICCRPAPGGCGRLRSPGSGCASSGSPRSPGRTSRGARSTRACRCGRASCACPLRLAPGPARNAFCTLASLLPGTLPAGSEPDGALRVHCLDLGQDVPAQMSAEEAIFLAALGRAAGDG